MLQQPGGERLLGRRRVVAHHPGHQPTDRLDHDHRRHLSPGQHVVADRQLAVDEVLAHPVVDALVATAQQREPVAGRQLGCHRLVETAAAGAQQEQRTRQVGLLDGGEHRLGRQHHAGAAAVGGVVDRAVRVGRSASRRFQHPQVEQVAVAGLADQAVRRRSPRSSPGRSSGRRSAARRSRRGPSQIEEAVGHVDLDHPVGRARRPRSAAGRARRCRAPAGRTPGWPAPTRPHRGRRRPGTGRGSRSARGSRASSGSSIGSASSTVPRHSSASSRSSRPSNVTRKRSWSGRDATHRQRAPVASAARCPGATRSARSVRQHDHDLAAHARGAW